VTPQHIKNPIIEYCHLHKLTKAPFKNNMVTTVEAMIIVVVDMLILYIIYFLSYTPARIAQKEQPEGYDNSNPRDQYTRLPDNAKRAVASAQNTLEAMIFLGSSVVALNLSNSFVQYPDAVFALAVIFGIVRIVYPFLYYYNFSTTRSIVFSIGFMVVIGFYIISSISLSKQFV